MEDAKTKEMKSEINRFSNLGHSTNSCYEHSFGGLGNDTRYVDVKSNTDMREFLGEKCNEGMAQLKALGSTTGGAGTAGYALVPIYVDKVIVDPSRKYTPLVEMIPRVTNMGLTADYNRLTAKGGGYTAIEDAPLPETNETYERKSVAIKFLYCVGRITGQMEAAMPSYMLAGFNGVGSGMTAGNVFSDSSIPTAKQTEVIVKARSMKELEENLIINGDASTDSTQFSGIVKLQGSTNEKDLSGAALSWLDIEIAVETAFNKGGRPDIAVASAGVVTQLRSILINTFGFRPSDVVNNTLPAGIPPQLVIQSMVGAITVFPSMYLNNTAGNKSIYFLDTDYIEMRVLQDLTYEELGKTNDTKKFMLKIYEALIMRCPEFNSFIKGIL